MKFSTALEFNIVLRRLRGEVRKIGHGVMFGMGIGTVELQKSKYGYAMGKCEYKFMRHGYGILVSKNCIFW